MLGQPLRVVTSSYAVPVRIPKYSPRISKTRYTPVRLAMFFTRIFLPFALGYFMSQLLRSVNAVVAPDLIGELSLDAWTVGFLTSAYFLTFACAQLPMGSPSIGTARDARKPFCS